MIISLYGADSFRSRRFLQELKNKFIKDVDPNSHSFSVIDGQSATLANISEQINTGSLFVKKRFVIIENIFKNKAEKIFGELAPYLEKLVKSDENILIFRDEDIEGKTMKAPAKKLLAFFKLQPYTQEFKALTPAQLLVFIKKEAALYNKDISAPAASLLINLTGGDLWQISAEVKKLSFRNAEPTISSEIIKEMVPSAYDENIFGLTDAISAKNKKLAISLLAEQYAAGLSDEYLLTMLIRQFKILLQIRESLDANMNPADIANRLKIHPYVAKKGALQAKNFSAASLKDYLNRLIYLDFSSKTGRGDIKTELSLLVSAL
jgi:DNA polymerase III subunit delta